MVTIDYKCLNSKIIFFDIFECEVSMHKLKDFGRANNLDIRGTAQRSNQKKTIASFQLSTSLFVDLVIWSLVRWSL